ncbi:MAG: hypothetical protein Q4C49_05380 [Bacillota bacterium]|nr:hypothetical protein [Bacillota bacterium]
MRLISLHIENFGKLHQYDLSFEPGMNAFCEENGYGKTTLGVFIKVMFYGFSNEKKKNRLERERILYKPWQGGPYGGRLTFSYQNKEYVISRLFAEKESQDICQIKEVATGLDTQDFSSTNIGYEIFQLDASSFARTMFVSQKEYEFTSFNDIDAKMGSFVSQSEDLQQFSLAKKNLEDQIVELTTPKKVGKLDLVQKEILSLQNQLYRKDGLEYQISQKEEAILDTQKEMDDLNNQLSLVQEEMKHISFVKDAAKRKAKYELLVKNVEEAKKNQEEILVHFPKGMPSLDQLASFKDKEKWLRSLSMENPELYKQFTLADLDMVEKQIHVFLQAKEYILKNDCSKEQKLKFKKEASYFSKGFDEKKNRSLIEQWSHHCNLEKASLSVYDISRFEGKSLDLEEVSCLKKHWQNAYPLFLNKKKEVALSSYEKQEWDSLHVLFENAEFPVSETKEKPDIPIIPLIVGSIVFLLGLFLLLFQQILLGLIVFIMGMLIVGIPLFPVLQGQEEKSLDLEREYERYLALKQRVDACEVVREEFEEANREELARSKELLESFGYIFVEEQAANLLDSLEKDYVSFVRNKKNVVSNRSLEEEVFAYVKRYGYTPKTENIISDLYEISSRYKSWILTKNTLENRSLQQYKKQYARLLSLLKEFFAYFHMEATSNLFLVNFQKIKDAFLCLDEKEKVEVELGSFKEQYGLVDSLESILPMAISLDSIQLAYQKALEEKDSFEREVQDLSFMEVNDSFEEDALSIRSEKLQGMNQNLQVLLEEKNVLVKEWDRLNGYFQELCEMEGRLSFLKEEEKKMDERLFLLKTSHQFLLEAKESLNQKYSAPFKKALSKYFSILGQSADFELEVDVNKNLSIQHQSISRDISYLSEGYKDIVDLCFRLALIEAMYPEEKPFIVLDDPFINLDEEKVDTGLDLLEKLQSHFQILYFTCHPSRNL